MISSLYHKKNHRQREMLMLKKAQHNRSAFNKKEKLSYLLVKSTLSLDLIKCFI